MPATLARAGGVLHHPLAGRSSTGQEFLDGIVKGEDALVDEHHGSGGADRLGR
jgi:hypothetical protein